MPKIYVAGQRGMVDSSVAKHLDQLRHMNFLVHRHAVFDLTNQAAAAVFLTTGFIYVTLMGQVVTHAGRCQTPFTAWFKRRQFFKA